MQEKPSLLHKLDDVFYAIERAFVVAAMSLMILMVFFDVVDRRLAAPESKLASFLTALHVPAAATLAPWFGLAVAFALIWFGFATVRRRRGGEGAITPALEPVLALAGTALLRGFGWLMMNRPSNEVYVAVWALAGAAALYAQLRSTTGHRALRVGLTAVALAVGAVVLWLIVPEGYSWAKEVAMILLVWTGLVGASMAAHQGRHIDIDFGKKMFPKNLRVPIALLANLVTIVFCALIVALGVVYVFGESGLYKLSGHFPHTGIPDWIVAFAIPWTFTTIGLRTLLTAKRVAAGNLEAKGSSPSAVAKKLGEH